MDKKSYIQKVSDMKRKTGSFEADIERNTPKRRSIMTTDDDEEFLKACGFNGRTDAFRMWIRAEKEKRGWRM